MNQVSMKLNNYANYSTNCKNLKNNNQNENSTINNITQTDNFPTFKGSMKMSKNSIKTAFAALVGAIGLGSIMKNEIKIHDEIKIYEEPIIGKDVDPKEAEILLNCWKDKNGGIKSIDTFTECDRGEYYTYTTVTYNNGQRVSAPPIVDTEENLIKKIKEFKKNHLDFDYDYFYSKSLKELYNKTIDSYATKIKQPETPVVLDKTELITKPSERDNFIFKGTEFIRSDAARLLRFGENSLINEDKNCLYRVEQAIKSYLGVDNPTNIRALKRFGSSNDTYIYYDKRTNLTTVFDKKGNIKGQVAFNTNYQEIGDEIPTDYKVYSIAINGKLCKFD